MAWVTRGNHAYYYKTHRIRGKVRSIYFGKGEEARLIARVDDMLRYAARLRAERRKAEQQPKT
jgi:hypothetical protein